VEILVEGDALTSNVCGTGRLLLHVHGLYNTRVAANELADRIDYVAVRSDVAPDLVVHMMAKILAPTLRLWLGLVIHKTIDLLVVQKSRYYDISVSVFQRLGHRQP
jgi:hypothetical protein